MNGMTPGFPQYTPTAKQGNIGVGIVSRIVEGFGWLFKKNPQEFDFGIDGQIEIVSANGAVTGQMLACQIKCGKSYLMESDRWGYVYRGETKHFNYLANYPVPVIIVLCDPDSGEAFWEVFHAGDTRPTESGWRMTVPFKNRLTDAKDRLEVLLPPLHDHLGELREYWQINNVMLASEMILFTIEREEVEAGDVSRVEDFRSRLVSSRELALHCKGKVEFSFNGYDDDPREMFEMQEANRYVAQLDHVMLELFFFIRTAPPAHTLSLFVFSLFGVGWEGERSVPGKPGKYIVDLPAMTPFLRRHFGGLNLICERLEIPEEEIARISIAVMRPFGYDPDAKRKN